jgi:glycine/D-amino acid oxidase-like deaminating enzyme
VLDRAHSFLESAEMVIAGGGGAGLAIGEMLQRSGCNVVLLEKAENLFSASSGNQHGWGHLGPLYATLADPKSLATAVQNVQHLVMYYRGFSGMNLRYDPTSGELRSTSHPRGWFRGNHSQLVYLLDQNSSQADRDAYKASQGMTWEESQGLFAARMQRYSDCDWRRGDPRDYISSASLPHAPTGARLEALVLDRSEVQHRFRKTTYGAAPDLVKAFLTLDRTLRVENIVSDLAKSFVAHGGRIQLNTELESFERRLGGVVVTASKGDTGKIRIEARKLILAMGRDSGSFFADDVFRKVNRVVSPLLVVAPALCDTNFQVLSPNPHNMINHLRHTFDGGDYSVIGDNSFAKDSDDPHLEADLISKARAVFPQFGSRAFDTYCCFKTEVSPGHASENRNRSILLEHLEDVVLLAIPGKLTFCFTLAVRAFRELTGGALPSPVVDPSYKRQDVSRYLKPLRHQQIAEKLLVPFLPRDPGGSAVL